MECGCISYGYQETVSVLSELYPIARRKHKCGECHREINTGEKYESVSYVVDGKIYRIKTCIDCLSVRDLFFCHCIPISGFWDVLKENMDYDSAIPWSGIAGLTKKVRDSVCDMIEECWAADK